jgi:hypothetical protein
MGCGKYLNYCGYRKCTTVFEEISDVYGKNCISKIGEYCSCPHWIVDIFLSQKVD